MSCVNSLAIFHSCPQLTAGGDAHQPNGHGYAATANQSYSQQASQQTRLPATTSRAAALGARSSPASQQNLVKELQPDDKITTFQFTGVKQTPLYADPDAEERPAFATSRKRNLPGGQSPFAGLTRNDPLPNPQQVCLTGIFHKVISNRKKNTVQGYHFQNEKLLS